MSIKKGIILFFVILSTIVICNGIFENSKVEVKSVYSISTYTNLCDEYINKVESLLLNSYEIDIKGEVLTDHQKQYITDMYILSNFNNYASSILHDGDEYIIDNLKYNEIYYELFGEKGSIQVNKKLSKYNVEKFHISNSKVISYDFSENMAIVVKEYTTNFLDVDYVYDVKYILSISAEACYLIGFNIEK